MLELIERLAELHIKRARMRELVEAASKIGKRDKAKIYRHAAKLLFDEILRIEHLIEQGL